MSASDYGCIGQPLLDAELVHDLEALRPQQLRDKYKSEANSHRAMLQRSHDGRIIDPAWSSFKGFLADMGRKPTAEHSIDRLDPDDPRYGPDLCRWATKVEQTRNRRNTIIVEWQGERITLAEFAERTGKDYGKVHYRFTKGDRVEDIAKDEPVLAGPFVPSRLRDDEDRITEWRKAYETWRARAIRSRRALARAEVFEMVVLSGDYRRAEAWLTSRGYFELTPEDVDRLAELGETPQGRMYRFGPDAIKEAARALLSNAPSIGLKIIGGTPFRWQDLWRWEDWFRGRESAEDWQ